MRMYPETKIQMPHSCSQISILVTESTKKKPSESGLDTPTIQEIAVAHSRHNLDLPPGLYNDISSSITLESLAITIVNGKHRVWNIIIISTCTHNHYYMQQEDTDLQMPLFSLDDEADDIFTNSNPLPQNAKNCKR